MNRSILLVLSILLLSCCNNEKPGEIEPKTAPEKTEIEGPRYDYTFDAEGKRFGTYLSWRYGANDIWLAYSTDGKSYKDVFTGCTLQPEAWSDSYTAAYADGVIIISYERAIEQGAETKDARFVAKLEEIERDSDGDGLSDLVEYRFMTDATNTDTDNDGKKDSEDTNPLASSKIKLSEQQDIWKAGFLQYHDEPPGTRVVLPSNGLVLAVFDSRAHFFEIPGRKDPVLAMTLEQVEEFGKSFGFHVPQACFSEVLSLAPENGNRKVAFELDIVLGPLHGMRCKLILVSRDGQWKLTDTTVERIY